MNLLDTSVIARSLRSQPSALPLFAATGLACISLVVALRAKSPHVGVHARAIPSPRTTLLPSLSETEAHELPYPPDVLPGARDVTSPYGTMRVYEWGPEEGRKVLLVHGISTPCISLAAIAHGLAEKGCRVMLLDLWGRGYSDTPDSLPHDSRLYTTSILLALTSSPLAWTGSSNSFSLIGYSLGGGISAAFTSYFPALVSSLVLLAPAGLIRTKNLSPSSKFLYSSSLVPESFLERSVGKRLSGGPTNAASVKPKGQVKTTSAETAVGAELPTSFDHAVFSKTRPGVTVASAVSWQISHHQGFIKSFISSIRYGPATDQHADWRRIGARLTAQNATTVEMSEASGLQNGKVLIMHGRADPIIIADELREDASEVLGQGNVKFEICECGHELPITKSEQVVDMVADFWDMK